MKNMEQDVYLDVGFTTSVLNYIIWQYTEDIPSGLNDNIVQIILENVVILHT